MPLKLTLLLIVSALVCPGAMAGKWHHVKDADKSIAMIKADERARTYKKGRCYTPSAHYQKIKSKKCFRRRSDGQWHCRAKTHFQCGSCGSKELWKSKKQARACNRSVIGNIGVELGVLQSNISNEMTSAASTINSAVNETLSNIEREAEQLWRNIVTEYNYFMATACGESSEAKQLARKLHQGQISKTKYIKAMREVKNRSNCNVGVNYDSNAGVSVTNASAETSHPVITSDELKLDYYFLNAELFEGNSLYVDSEAFIAAVAAYNDKSTWPGEPRGFVMAAPNGTGEIRSDRGGDGAFGASRGNRRHRGVDYASLAGSDVVSPVTGIIDRVSNAYTDPVKNGPLKAIVIKNIVDNRYETKVLYVEPSKHIKPGMPVYGGQTLLGKTQSMVFIHENVKDHIHVQIDGPQGSIVPIAQPLNDMPLY